MRLSILSVALALIPCPALRAHIHMLLPDRPAVKAGEVATVTYQFGHPFEAQLFDAEKPARAVVYSPEGEATDVLSKLEKVDLPGPEKRKVAAFRLAFKPPGRGDYTLVFESPPIWMEDDKHFVRDTTRVVIHVQAQKGWDDQHGDKREFTLVPMTRPYGLRPGTVFQARINAGGPHDVELERYNVAPPAVLPPDEQITLAFRTDDRGTATCALPEPGWWGLTATRRATTTAQRQFQEHDGKKYWVHQRATLWVFVDDPAPRKPAD